MIGRSWIRYSTALGLGVLLLYVVVRLSLIPADPARTPAFVHDSAYIAVVARNVAEGRGYVNDAHWLLFLNPPSLPMPFHNANPLYPTLCALVAALTSGDPARAGCVISVLAHALLAASVYVLVRRFHPDARLAAVAAALAALWPTNWRASFMILPDALSTALSFSLLAVVVSGTTRGYWLLAGVLFGLAWLTRSTASLILPGLVLWAWRRCGFWTAARGLALFSVAAVVVMSPWLVHTARTRGSPFASDTGYYWLQNYHADRTGRTLDQYWRSLTPPPPLSDVLRRDAGGFARFVASGVPAAVDRLTGVTEGVKPSAIALLVLSAMALVWIRSWWTTPEFLAALLTGVLSLLSVAVRAATLETRYLGVANTLLALLLVMPLWRAGSPAVRRWVGITLLAWFLVFPARHDVQMLRALTAPEPSLQHYPQIAGAASAHLSLGSAMVTDEPYLFTYFTRRPALSPPYASKQTLLEVMDRYRATHMLLPRDRLSYYYPTAPASLAPELIPAADVDRYALLARRRSPSP